MKKNFNNNRTYNNCFCIGGKATDQKGNKRKVPGYIDLHGNAIVLWGGKKGPHRRTKELTNTPKKNLILSLHVKAKIVVKVKNPCA